jgi:hypothetical protein
MKTWWWAFSVVMFVAAILVVKPAPARASMDMSHARYLGKPDLPLTSAMIAAGGGAQAFSSVRLSDMLTAQHSKAEVAHLNARFGAARMHRYFTTFDAFVDAAIADVRYRHVTLPRPNPALARDPYVLSASLRAAGVMPDGRFDVGYFIEHLISRPVHIHVMKIANASPAIGPAANADFHVILTAEMDDLKSLYHLPR